jgi:signal transduction histidine kinase
MAREPLAEHVRDALAQVEEQRDDAIVYLSTIKVVLDLIAHGGGLERCGQEIAEALVAQLGIETCAVALSDEHRRLRLGGFATQAQRVGGPRGGLDERGWLALAGLVRPGVDPTCFRRLADGSFEATAPGALAGDGFFVLPLAVGDELGGALVLHSLVAPAIVLARGRALGLLADIVGQALTIARMRDALQRLTRQLEDELGVARRLLSDQQASLRSQEGHIGDLTQALIRSNRVKREFLGNVSHELRTPLNAILGYTSLMRDGMAGPVSDEQTGLLDRVLSNTHSLHGLIDDVLFFVQLEADRVSVRRQRVDVRELVLDVLGAVPEPADRKFVPVRVDVDPATATFQVDPALLRRLLFHLVFNALKFTLAGEVTVRVHPGDERDTAVVVVADTGVGIPAEKLAQVFDLFAQADGSNTRRFNGMGMGLTLVQRCARLLGGEMHVRSEPGHGSEFRVTIPGVLGDVAAPLGATRRTNADTVH